MKDTLITLLAKTVPAMDDEAKAKVLHGESLITTGVIDSLSLVQFVSEIENQFGFEFDPEDMDFANFETLEKIEALIVNKKSA